MDVFYCDCPQEYFTTRLHLWSIGNSLYVGIAGLITGVSRVVGGTGEVVMFGTVRDVGPLPRPVCSLPISQG
jgi:hypothetical protein